MKASRNKLNLLGKMLTMLAMMATALAMPASVSAKMVDVDMSEYGYGKYVVTAKGIGHDGVYDEDSVTFYYLPVVANIVNDGQDGEYQIKLEYSADDGTEDSGDVAKIQISIYDDGGNVIKPLSPITILPPTTDVHLPLGDYDLPSGHYEISITAYDKNGNVLYKPYVISVNYDADEDILVPDTGSVMRDHNVARADYLTAGILVFAAVAAYGIFTILKGNQKANRKTARKTGITKRR